MAPYQLRAVFCPERYALVEASTKSGKTAACLVWLLERAMEGREGQSFWWVAPVYAQAEIAFNRMLFGIPRSLYRANKTDRWVELANGARIWFKSGERPDSLYGDDVYAAVIDEASRLDEHSWHAVRSTLTATRGPIRIIGNVVGRTNWFYRLARRAERGEPGMRYSRITFRDAVEAKILQQAEIDDAKARLPEHVFLELYGAEAADLQGRVYKSFGPDNIDENVADDPQSELRIGMDFNVNPMTAVVGRLVTDQLHIFDEITISNSNTVEMCAEIKARYLSNGTAKRRCVIYPDPSANQRRSSAPVGQTDLSILRAAGFSVDIATSAIPVVDRVNEVNALCKAASGARRLFVHPRCRTLIDSLENLLYKPGTSLPDKEGGLDHAADALGYLVHQEFPIQSRAWTSEEILL